MARGFIDGAEGRLRDDRDRLRAGDRKILKDLLSRDVYDGFERAIVERENRGEKVETTFVSIDRADIAGVEVRGQFGARSSSASCRS